MAALIYSGQALTDLDRLSDFLLEADPASAQETAGLIIEAVEVLTNHPLIGRTVEEGLRGLIISRGQSGYVALYSYEEAEDAVLILAVRHQREAGYPADVPAAVGAKLSAALSILAALVAQITSSLGGSAALIS